MRNMSGFPTGAAHWPQVEPVQGGFGLTVHTIVDEADGVSIERLQPREGMPFPTQARACDYARRASFGSADHPLVPTP